MGRSLRSKKLQRELRKKRTAVRQLVELPRLFEKNAQMERVVNGEDVTPMQPKNAFLYPADAEASYPQKELLDPLDLRYSATLPYLIQQKREEKLEKDRKLNEKLHGRIIGTDFPPDVNYTVGSRNQLRKGKPVIC
ncbi:MAG: hypothetical protein KVP17_001429 [Porospora cf. gigantea B]|uniref:uncharacterized protein n=1 Tax=Porospora cf. gigantea B TaxID=2853592 RepID=UPI003571F2D1|nr:MAG: hypothetical protein KVP17_001429 [Porospora cf. gigantea B]